LRQLTIDRREEAADDNDRQRYTTLHHMARCMAIDHTADGIRVNSPHLRQDATWHDGSPVTAEDVKWSLDRVVGARTTSKSQAETGSMTSPDQFRVAGPGVVEITLPRPDRMALPNIATVYIPMYNAGLARRNATEVDPWATEWLKANSAADGAYFVEAFRPGEQVVLRRNEAWKPGPLDVWQERQPLPPIQSRRASQALPLSCAARS
jgi:peptide/nickel transport system substrate-binding protein